MSEVPDVTFDAAFVAGLQPLSPRDAASRRPAVTLFEAVNEIAPVDLYCYLYARFGPPNGLQNFLRNDHSDNLIHWHWTVRHDNGLLDVQGSNFRTLFFATGLGASETHHWPHLIAALKADFASYGPQMSKCRKSLEHWIEFVSPYQRLRRSIEQLMDELARLQPDEVHERPSPIEQGDREAQQALAEEWDRSARTLSKAFGICFGIRSMLPVLAESFVNLLLFSLMQDDLRADKRLRENAFREHIDIRIRNLHRHCRGFAKPVDYRHPACARLHTLINERNDLLHGNVAIEKLRFNELFFAGNVPVFKRYRSMWERAFEVQRRSVGLPAVQQEFAVVIEFIDYVLSCLESRVRASAEQVFARLELGYNERDDRVAVLLPEHLVDFRPGP